MSPSDTAYWLGCAAYLGRCCPACHGDALHPERAGQPSDLICPCGERLPVEQVVDMGRVILERHVEADAAGDEAGHRRRPKGRQGPWHVAGSDTSEAAARSMLATHGHLQEAVLNFVTHCGASGSTCDEVEIGLRLRHQTAAARLRELEIAGRVRKTEQRRKTRSGRTATVYRVVQRQQNLFGDEAAA